MKNVYALLDPRKPGIFEYGTLKFSMEPFYIGYGVKGRENSHYKDALAIYESRKIINGSNRFKLSKIIKIIEAGLKPEVVILDMNIDKKEALELEIRYIKQIGRSICNEGPLTNVMKGGNSFPEYTYDYSLRKHPSKGRRLTDEQKTRISLAQRGRKHSDEQIRKHKDKITGRKHTPETCLKISNSNKGKKNTPETIEKMKNAQSNRSMITEDTRNKMRISASKTMYEYDFYFKEAFITTVFSFIDAIKFCKDNNLSSKFVAYKKNRDNFKNWRVNVRKK